MIPNDKFTNCWVNQDPELLERICQKPEEKLEFIQWVIEKLPIQTDVPPAWQHKVITRLFTASSSHEKVAAVAADRLSHESVTKLLTRLLMKGAFETFWEVASRCPPLEVAKIALSALDTQPEPQIIADLARHIPQEVLHKACITSPIPLFHKASVLQNLPEFVKIISPETCRQLCRQKDGEGHLPIYWAAINRLLPAIAILKEGYPEGADFEFCRWQLPQAALAAGDNELLAAYVGPDFDFKRLEEELVAQISSGTCDEETLKRAGYFGLYYNILAMCKEQEYQKACDAIQRGGLPYPCCFVNSRHMQVATAEVVIPQAAPIDIRKELVSIFDSINFTDPNLPGYKDLDKVNKNESRDPATRKKLKEGLERYVTLTLARKHFLAVPENPNEMKRYFDTLNNLAQHLTHHLVQLTKEAKEAKTDKERDLILADRNELVIELALAGRWCGTRFMGIAQNLVLPLFSGTSQAQSLASVLRSQLQELRMQCLHKAIQEEEFVSVHTYNRYMFLLGGEVGLTRASGSYADEEYSGHITKEHARGAFDRHYTRFAIFDRMLTAINGDETGKKLIDREQVLDWFKEHVDDILGELVIDDPQSYIEAHDIFYKPESAEKEIETCRKMAFLKAHPLPSDWDSADKKFSTLTRELAGVEGMQKKVAILLRYGIRPGPDVDAIVTKAKESAYLQTVPKDWDDEKGTFGRLQREVSELRQKFQGNNEAARKEIAKLLRSHEIPYSPHRDLTMVEAIRAHRVEEFLASIHTPDGAIRPMNIAQLLACFDVVGLEVSKVSEMRSAFFYREPNLETREAAFCFLHQFYAEAKELSANDKFRFISLLLNSPIYEDPRTTEIDQMLSTFLVDAQGEAWLPLNMFSSLKRLVEGYKLTNTAAALESSLSDHCTQLLKQDRYHAVAEILPLMQDEMIQKSLQTLNPAQIDRLIERSLNEPKLYTILFQLNVLHPVQVQKEVHERGADTVRALLARFKDDPKVVEQIISLIPDSRVYDFFEIDRFGESWSEVCTKTYSETVTQAIRAHAKMVFDCKEAIFSVYDQLENLNEQTVELDAGMGNIYLDNLLALVDRLQMLDAALSKLAEPRPRGIDEELTDIGEQLEYAGFELVRAIGPESTRAKAAYNSAQEAWLVASNNGLEKACQAFTTLEEAAKHLQAIDEMREKVSQLRIELSEFSPLCNRLADAIEQKLGREKLAPDTAANHEEFAHFLDKFQAHKVIEYFAKLLDQRALAPLFLDLKLKNRVLAAHLAELRGKTEPPADTTMLRRAYLLDRMSKKEQETLEQLTHVDAEEPVGYGTWLLFGLQALSMVTGAVATVLQARELPTRAKAMQKSLLDAVDKDVRSDIERDASKMGSMLSNKLDALKNLKSDPTKQEALKTILSHLSEPAQKEFMKHIEGTSQASVQDAMNSVVYERLQKALPSPFAHMTLSQWWESFVTDPDAPRQALPTQPANPYQLILQEKRYDQMREHVEAGGGYDVAFKMVDNGILTDYGAVELLGTLIDKEKTHITHIKKFALAVLAYRETTDPLIKRSLEELLSRQKNLLGILDDLSYSSYSDPETRVSAVALLFKSHLFDNYKDLLPEIAVIAMRLLADSNSNVKGTAYLLVQTIADLDPKYSPVEPSNLNWREGYLAKIKYNLVGDNGLVAFIELDALLEQGMPRADATQLIREASLYSRFENTVSELVKQTLSESIIKDFHHNMIKLVSDSGMLAQGMVVDALRDLFHAPSAPHLLYGKGNWHVIIDVLLHLAARDGENLNRIFAKKLPDEVQVFMSSAVDGYAKAHPEATSTPQFAHLQSLVMGH